ncbi:PKD domain-containing protein [Rubellicoccus peritrichatus]|uniref:PKD/Chitinase domain-containing protein n=1 Tax=Rubellicoccus peritrichatus TaxID=3080537 RepID=A0AAQ3LDU9_9BACT|nr:hypothetical protein [Puniceicoccus sp. CR14]WOO40294.1 hypothetical protein RZN69_16870 [Puniceicoccus sp. CR14]
MVANIRIINAYTDYSGTMNDFMGINIQVPYYQYRYLAENPDFDLSQSFKWVRNYMLWAALEPQNDLYKFNDFKEIPLRRYDDYYRRLNEDGQNIVTTLITVPNQEHVERDSFYRDIVPWFTGDRRFPAEGSGFDANDYRERAEFLAQLTARYGPTGGLSETKLETNDKVQGLDYVRYFEGANEPNQKTNDVIWPDAAYAVWMNAAFDGRGVIRDGGLPIAGSKQGDPNVNHLMAGLVDNGVDLGFLDHTFLAAGRQTFDAINIHAYFRNKFFGDPIEKFGVSPEFYILESGKDELQKTLDWRDRNTPGTPVWLTEFGWDTHLSGAGLHSETYAPEPSQGNYIMRTFPLLKKLGFEKAFVYYDFDPLRYGTAMSTSIHMSSGLITHKHNSIPHRRKPGFFYMTAMSAAIGEYTFDGAHIFGEGTPELYAYVFSKSPTDKVVMMWCRERDAQIDNGTTIANYEFAVPFVEGCEQIVPADQVLGGISTILSVSQAGEIGASVAIDQLSEKPLFLKFTGSQILNFNIVPEVRLDSDQELILPIPQYTLSSVSSDEDGTIVSYRWTQLSGPEVPMSATNAADLVLSNLIAGNYEFMLQVTDNDGATARDRIKIIVSNRQPYLGARLQIPGVIEAEAYDLGGEGIAYHDTSPGRQGNNTQYRPIDDVDVRFIGDAANPSGFQITDLAQGEWLKYSVNVAESGLYTLEALINRGNAANSAPVKRLSFEINDVALAGVIRPEYNPNGFQSYMGEGPFYLEAGDHSLKLTFINAVYEIDKFIITPFVPTFTGGNYFRFDNASANWHELRIFYDVIQGGEIDVLSGGNTHLDLYITNLDISLIPDWSRVRLAIYDINNNYGQVSIGDYLTNIGENWTLISIPLVDFTDGTNLDLQHLKSINLRSARAGSFKIGLDELTFNGGATPFVWLGDSHENNPTSSSSIVMSIVSDGGAGGSFYDEPPFVDASPDKLVRPTVSTHTFNGNAYDINGTITNYEWIQMSGPDLISSSDSSSPILTIDFDTFGTYVFRLYAWDDAGQRGEDDVILVYEDTGGYLEIDHTEETNSFFKMLYAIDGSKFPLNALGSSNQPNTTMEIHLKRFDLSTQIDWNKFQIILKSTKSNSFLTITLGNYIVESVNDSWVKVSIPLSSLTLPVGFDFSYLYLMRINSIKAGPFNDLGIDEIQFTGGSHPAVFYGDDHSSVILSDIPFEMPAVLQLANGAKDTAP